MRESRRWQRKQGKSYLHLYMEKQVHVAVLCCLPQLGCIMFPKPLSESPTIKWQTDLCAATHRRAHTAVLVSASVAVREIYSLILKGHLVWMLLVIIPKRKCQKYCWALQVDILGILTKRGGKFYFSLISDTWFFILSFQFLMSYPLWPLFSPKLQNQRFKLIQL